MTELRFRPEFSLTVRHRSALTVANKIQESIETEEALNGQFTDRHAMISFVEQERHFWSPWMNVEVNENEGACEVRTRFSPHPNIWTGFVFSYLLLAVGCVFSVIAGLSQLLIKQSPFAFLLLAVCAIGGVLLWLVSKVGQRLAQPQMAMMKEVIERATAF